LSALSSNQTIFCNDHLVGSVSHTEQAPRTHDDDGAFASVFLLLSHSDIDSKNTAHTHNVLVLCNASVSVHIALLRITIVSQRWRTIIVNVLNYKLIDISV